MNFTDTLKYERDIKGEETMERLNPAPTRFLVLYIETQNH